jgi:integrase
MGVERNRLTARGIVAINRPGRHADGGNLYLNVTPTGARSWVFMYRHNGKQREMGLGSAADTTLAKARDLASSYRRDLKEGRDPLAVRGKISTRSFGEVADEYIESMRPGWRNAKHAAQWVMTLTHYAAPLRPLAVSAVDTEAVLAVLRPIWSEKPETASRVRGRIASVLDAAKAKGLRTGDNPARWRWHLDQLLPKRQGLSRGHHAAMPYANVPDFMKLLGAVEGASALALQFTILTAARSGETLGARWSELDLTSGVWTVPAARMKGAKEHRVPLVGRALDLIAGLAAVRQGDFVFPGARPNKPLSNMAMDMALRRLKVNVTTHGFRSSFRDWAAEQTDFPHELAEMALAHSVGTAVTRAYRRSDMFAKRRELMDAWATYCANWSG